MQPDRRHELENNVLAESASALAERCRPYLGTLGLGAAAVLLGLAAWTLVDSRSAAEREESWDACLAAMGTGQAAALGTVADRYPGTSAAQWARLVTADGLLDQGSQFLYTDRAQAEQRLQAAVATYTTLLASNPVGFVAERATFGLAKTRENLGLLDEARRGYEAVVREHPESAVRPFAEERIAALGRDSTRQWYDWFASQKPVQQKAVQQKADQQKPDGAAATPPSPAAAPAEPAGGAPAGTGSGTGAPG